MEVWLGMVISNQVNDFSSESFFQRKLSLENSFKLLEDAKCLKKFRVQDAPQINRRHPRRLQKSPAFIAYSLTLLLVLRQVVASNQTVLTEKFSGRSQADLNLIAIN